MKKLLVMLALIFTVSAFTYVEASELKWTGCGISKKAFMEELANAYEKKTGTKIILKGSGATDGIRNVAKGEFDLGGSCRHKINVPEEKDATLHHVAWDALVFIVNDGNPVDSVTEAQIKKVYTGKIKNWKELGGADAPIKLVDREGKTSGTGLMLRELLFNNPDEEFTSDAEYKKSTGPIEAAVSADPLTISATGVSSAQKRDKIKMLKVNGVAPTKENIMSGKYSLYRPLYITTKGEPSGETKKFLEFALSDEGQAIIAAQGTVNLKEGKSLKKR